MEKLYSPKNVQDPSQQHFSIPIHENKPATTIHLHFLVKQSLPIMLQMVGEQGHVQVADGECFPLAQDDLCIFFMSVTYSPQAGRHMSDEKVMFLGCIVIGSNMIQKWIQMAHSHHIGII